MSDEYLYFLGYPLTISEVLGFWLNIILVFITGALALYTAKLRTATVTLAKSSEQTAKKELHAYISMEDFYRETVDFSAAGLAPHWKISVNWVNGGKTPARNFINNINWKTFDNKLPDDFDFPDRTAMNMTPGNIGAGSTYLSPDIYIPCDLLTTYSLSSLQYVYIWGWADYDDVVGGPRHRTEFCYQIFVNEALRFIPYGRFNSTDDDCLRRPRPYTT